MGDFILYNYFRSSASYRVRLAMNIKGLAFEYRPVHLLNNGGEQHSDEYRHVNPSREVPTLIHKGRAIGQSMAILEYLDHVQAEPRLFPEDAYQRALVIQACEIVNSGAQPLVNLRVLQALGSKFGATPEQKEEWSQTWLSYGLQALETFLVSHASEYCFGQTLTAADCFLIPHLFSCDRNKVDLSSYPTLLRIRGNLEKLESFQRAAPAVQPDAQ